MLPLHQRQHPNGENHAKEKEKNGLSVSLVVKTILEVCYWGAAIGERNSPLFFLVLSILLKDIRKDPTRSFVIG